MAGGEGFEPSTPNLGGNPHLSDADRTNFEIYNTNTSAVLSSIVNRAVNCGGIFADKWSSCVEDKRVSSNGISFDWIGFGVWLRGKGLSEQYCRAVVSDSKKYGHLLFDVNGLASLVGVGQNVLKALANLSKFLGCYEEYRNRMKSYGLKWSSGNGAFDGFLHILSNGEKHSSLSEWIRSVKPLLTEEESLFVRFLAVTGMRKGEGVLSFNKIISMNAEGRLNEYFNKELGLLEHYKDKRFLRGTKNAFISCVSEALVLEIANSKPISYNAIHCRLLRRKIKLRLKELRSYQNSYLRKSGVISELVDVLAGRIPKSVFIRHYLSEDVKKLSGVVVGLLPKLEEELSL